MNSTVLIFIISALVIVSIIIRPFKLAEVFWAVGGAFLLLICRLISPDEALGAVLKGTDVYLFLAGIMLLSEVAKEEHFFDWLAARAIAFSGKSPVRLFFLVYAVGVLTTVFLSNDATVVVLTPAVFAAVKAARVKNPLPYLFICAFVANAASFVLPISNPANLVVYGSKMPSLLVWLRQYTIPSIVAIVITCFCLFYTQKKKLEQNSLQSITLPPLSRGGKLAGLGILSSAIVLLVCSSLNIPLGLPTAIIGTVVFLSVTISGNLHFKSVLFKISWSVLPLVAGLFVVIESLYKTGILQLGQQWLMQEAHYSTDKTVWISGTGLAFFSNVINNLPIGLMAANLVQTGHLPEIIQRAILVGVDLGPNLSVTGSLATILWLVILRKEGIQVSPWQFLKLGIIVMIPGLLLSIASLFI